MPSSTQLTGLELTAKTLRKKFRVSFSGLCLLFAVTGPLCHWIDPLSSWFVMLSPLALAILLNLGHRFFGSAGAGIGLGAGCIAIIIVGSVYGEGILSISPLAVYCFPTFVAIVSGPVLAVTTMIGIVSSISYLYINRYLLNPPLDYVFDFANWRFISAAIIIFTHAFCAWLIPYFESYRDCTVIALSEVGKEHEDAIEQMKDATTKARDSLAAYSHEIRTPLNVIHAMADALLRSHEPMQEQHTVLIRLLHSCAQQLLLISNNVLDVSAIWAGALSIHDARFELASALKDWITIAKETAQRRSINITYQFIAPPGTPSFVIGDESRLRQILYNITDHSLRRASQGASIYAIARINRTSDDVIQLCVTVTDYADSMTVQQASTILALPSLAQRQSDVASSVALGMYVARKLCKALHGSLRCDATERGVSYIVNLPFDVSIAPVEEKRNLKILYAEDEPTNQFVLKTILKGSGHTIECGNDGLETFRMYEKANGDYDVVLLDMNMPVMNGLECAKAIRAYEARNSLRPKTMAYVSAAPITGDDLKEGNVDAVLQKPTRKAHLLDYLDTIKIETPTLLPVTRTPSPQVTPPVSVPQRLLDGLRVVLFPVSMPPLWTGKYHASLAVATAFVLLFLWSFVHARVVDSVHNLIIVATFCVYPAILRFTSRPSLWLFLYSPIHLLAYVWDMALSGAGFDSFFLHSGYAIILALVVGASRRTLFLTAILQTVSCYAILYLHWFEIVKFPLRFTEHDLALRVMVFWNIATFMITVWTVWCNTIRRSAFKGLVRSNQELVRTKRKTTRKQLAMQELASNVSYDIRTPLNVVLGVTDRLKSEVHLPESIRQSAGVLDTAGGMLLHLLDNVMDARMVNSGDQISIQSGKINLRAFSQRICAMMGFYARGKKLGLMLRISDTIPPVVMGDALRLQQLIVNLVTNAIKFTNRGAVTVTIDNDDEPAYCYTEMDATSSATKMEADAYEIEKLPPLPTETVVRSAVTSPQRSRRGSLTQTRVSAGSSHSSILESDVTGELQLPQQVNLRFTVDDTGPGIDKDLAPVIFSQYQVGVTDVARENRGTGLGLYISKAIVSRLGGEIGYTNSTNGSSFWFTLPTTIALEVDSDDELTPHNEWTRPLSLLVIEDAPEMQYVMRLLIQGTPHKADMAFTAAEGLEMFRSRVYDLVLLDQHLPDMDGPQVAQCIRAMPTGSKVMIAAVTADASETAQSAALAAGCDRFLSKPLTKLGLHQLLHSVETTGSLPSTPRKLNSRKVTKPIDLASEAILNVLLPSEPIVLQHAVGQFSLDSGRVSGKTSGRNSSRVSPVTSPVLTSALPHVFIRPEPKEDVLVPASLYGYLMDDWLPRLNDELLEMKTHLESGEIRKMQQIAHRIKGSAATFGLVKIGEACKEIMHADSENAGPLIHHCITSLSRSEFVKVEDS